MKRNNDEIKKEKNRITTAISAIDNVKNSIPITQKRTYNFKGRKSSNIATKLLKSVAPYNGKICDPFLGSGAFAIAAAEADLDFYGTELDNYIYSVNKVLFSECNVELIISMFREIETICKKDIMNLYSTKCCGIKNYISKLHFDPEGDNELNIPEYFNPTPHRDILNNETIILSAPCPICGAKRKKFEEYDLNKIKYCNNLDTRRFPSHKLIENSRINITSAHGADIYNRNYTKRAQYALLTLQDTILTFPESIERDFLEHCLVASLTLARTCQYGSGSEYIYQVMRKQAQEKNVWEIFEDKVNYFIRFKKDYSYTQSKYLESNNSKLTIRNLDYRVFLSEYNNEFDVIYTDPPYTDQVPYLERSQLYRDWLHCFYDKTNKFILTTNMLNNEIVVTNAPSRVKSKSGLIQYYQDIDEMFKYFYNALKPNGRVVLTIKLGSSKYLLTLAEFIKLARKNGFEYIAKVGIDKKDPTLRKQAAIKNTMMKEIVVFFTKLDKDSLYWFKNDVNIESVITKFIYQTLKEKNEGFVFLTEAISKTQSYLTHKHNILPSINTQEKIRKIILDNFFVANNSFVYIDSNRLYISEENTKDLFEKLYDIIPIIIKSIASDDGFTLEDLYYEIVNTLFDDDGNVLDQIIESKKHETQIRILLENYCYVNHDCRYVLKNNTYTPNPNAKDISSMDGYEFEDLIKNLLIKKGYHDVIRVGGANDRGVDIIAKKLNSSFEEEGYIFQCKRWLGNVGSTPIQRLHSMMTQMSQTISHAICITTSDYTPAGYDEGKSTGVKLINGFALINELNSVFPNEYYHAALSLIKKQ